MGNDSSKQLQLTSSKKRIPAPPGSLSCSYKPNAFERLVWKLCHAQVCVRCSQTLLTALAIVSIDNLCFQLRLLCSMPQAEQAPSLPRACKASDGGDRTCSLTGCVVTFTSQWQVHHSRNLRYDCLLPFAREVEITMLHTRLCSSIMRCKHRL
jgi:hypothetical protein